MELANFSSDQGNRVRVRLWQYSLNDSSQHLCEARLIIHIYNLHAVINVNHGPNSPKFISFWFTDSTKCFRQMANATAQVLIELPRTATKTAINFPKNIVERRVDRARAPPIPPQQFNSDQNSISIHF